MHTYRILAQREIEKPAFLIGDAVLAFRFVGDGRIDHIAARYEPGERGGAYSCDRNETPTGATWSPVLGWVYDGVFLPVATV